MYYYNVQVALVRDIVVEPNNQCAAAMVTTIVAIIVLPLLIFTSQESIVRYMIWESILNGGALSIFMFFLLLTIALIVILCIVQLNNGNVTDIAGFIICLLVFSFVLIIIYLTVRGRQQPVGETKFSD